MHRKRLFTKYVSCFVALTIVLMSMPIQTVCAAMVGTETVFTMAQYHGWKVKGRAVATIVGGEVRFEAQG